MGAVKLQYLILERKSHLLQGIQKILPDSKVKNIFWTLAANTINEPQPGYCVNIELYTSTVSSGWARFSLVSIGHYRKTMKTYANKSIRPYFRPPCCPSDCLYVCLHVSLKFFWTLPDLRLTDLPSTDPAYKHWNKGKSRIKTSRKTDGRIFKNLR